MAYQNEEIESLVGTKTEMRDVKNKKEYRILGGLAVVLLCAMTFLAGHSSSSVASLMGVRVGGGWRSDPLYVNIYGNLQYDSEGTYVGSKDRFNGAPIFDRDDGRFFAFMNPDRNWGITSGQYRDEFVNQGGFKTALLTSTNKPAWFYMATFPGQSDEPTMRTIDADLPYDMSGTYEKTGDIFNGRALWDRDDGVFFAFYTDGRDRRWAITASQYRDQFVGQKGYRGALAHSVSAGTGFLDAVFPGEIKNEPAGTKSLRGGNIQDDSEGTYIASVERFNGQPIWDRDDGKKFAVLFPDGYWYIMNSTWDVRKKLNGGSGRVNGRRLRALTPTENFRDAAFMGQDVILVGNLSQGTGGRYNPTANTFNGKPIWAKDDKIVLAFQNDDGKWCMSGYQYLSLFVKQSTGSMGYVVCSVNESMSFTDAWFPGQTDRIPPFSSK